MSDHPKEADRNLKRIFICDDIYLDVFRLLAPAKVGLEMATVADRFDAMVDTHFKYRKWTLGTLRIWSMNIFKKNGNGTEKEFQFPQKPLPASIVGFSSVDINWINSADAMAFLQRIDRLLKSDISLKIHISAEFDWNIFFTSVWPLLNVSAIIKIYFRHPSVFQNIRRLISPTILRDCVNLRMITCNYENVLQFPPDDSKGSSYGQVLCKWLHTPRADGRPKVIKSWRGAYSFPMDTLITTFLNATTSVNFFIRFRFCCAVVSPLELVNSLTHEQLTCRRTVNGDDEWWLIERSPIDKCAKQWAKWEKETLDDGTNDWKVLGILS